MEYSEFVEVYEAVSKKSGRLEKTSILADFLRRLSKSGKARWIYLLNGRVTSDYDVREFGISGQLTIKAIASAYGISSEKVVERFKKVGDLGEIAEEFSNNRKQAALFKKKLTVDKVFDNLTKLLDLSGKGVIEKKIDLISELLVSASGSEAKYIVRTILSDLRVGIASSTIIDALAEAFFPKEREEAAEKLEEAYDLANDFALVFESGEKGLREVEKISLAPGRPINVMLAPKAEDVAEGFKICGKPAAIEQKYDGFRMLINKDKDGKITLFTRRLENVTTQFPDVVDVVKNHVKGESFILDSEVVGYDKKERKYKPFQYISQRIKRKYGIDKMIRELPVEINIFDVIYYNGKSVMKEPFLKRRKILEKVVKDEAWKIRLAVQIITDSEDDAEKFYEEALKVGEEGIMMKNLNAPYKQGRRIGYMVKIKPEMKDLDLAIVGAEYGSGKRGGLLTSYILACRSEGKLLEIGKVSSGLKEKEEEGLTYEQMSKMLKPLIVEEKDNAVSVKPKIVVAVRYQNIQASPSYSSGYALRFPRIAAYRPDRSVKDITSLEEIKKEIKKGR